MERNTSSIVAKTDNVFRGIALEPDTIEKIADAHIDFAKRYGVAGDYLGHITIRAIAGFDEPFMEMSYDEARAVRDVVRYSPQARIVEGMARHGSTAHIQTEPTPEFVDLCRRFVSTGTGATWDAVTLSVALETAKYFPSARVPGNSQPPQGMPRYASQRVYDALDRHAPTIGEAVLIGEKITPGFPIPGI